MYPHMGDRVHGRAWRNPDSLDRALPSNEESASWLVGQRGSQEHDNDPGSSSNRNRARGSKIGSAVARLGPATPAQVLAGSVRAVGVDGVLATERNVPEREPALHILFNRQICSDDRLQGELFFIVPTLVTDRDKWIECASLIQVDPVGHALVAGVLERVERAEKLRREAMILEASIDGVRRGDDGLKVVSIEQDPAVAIGVGRQRHLDVGHLLEDVLELRFGVGERRS